MSNHPRLAELGLEPVYQLVALKYRGEKIPMEPAMARLLVKLIAERQILYTGHSRVDTSMKVTMCKLREAMQDYQLPFTINNLYARGYELICEEEEPVGTEFSP